ncbi:MAG: hypothetical protein ACPL3C_11715, partial [Pyrobaculum sp.]
MLTDFEALRAYLEARNTAVSSIRDVVETAQKIISGGELSKSEKRTADLLWHLGLVLKTPGGALRPTAQLRAVARGSLDSYSLIARRLARWTPMRILLRYLAAKGGAAGLDDVAEELGAEMKNVTGKYLPVLRLANPRLKAPVSKPFNPHVVEAVLFKLGAEVGLLTYDRAHKTASLTELAEEHMEQQGVEVVRTAPDSPIVLAAVATSVTSAKKVYIISPWVDDKVAQALDPLLHGRKAVVISREPHDEPHRRGLEILSKHGEAHCYRHL